MTVWTVESQNDKFAKSTLIVSQQAKQAQQTIFAI